MPPKTTLQNDPNTAALQAAAAAQQTGQSSSNTPTTAPGDARVTRPGEEAVTSQLSEQLRGMMGPRRGSHTSISSNRRIRELQEAEPPSPTGTVPGSRAYDDDSHSHIAMRAISRHNSMQIEVDYSRQEEDARVFAGALREEVKYLSDEARLQPICDEVNRLVAEAKAAVAGTDNEPDFSAAIAELKKVMDHTSQDAADAIQNAITANPNDIHARELAMAHHGRRVSGTMDIGNAESGKVYHTANLAGNIGLSPAPSLIPAIFGQGKAPAVAAAVATVGATAAIPVFHTISHMCTIPAQALVDNGGCTLRPDDPSLGLKSLVQAEADLKAANAQAKQMMADGDRDGARALLLEARKNYKNCEGAAKINAVNQMPQAHVRLARQGVNVSAAVASYLGQPGVGAGLQYTAALGGQVGLMHASKVGGLAKEEEKLQMFLQLCEPVTTADIKKHFQGPIKARFKLTGEVLSSYASQLEQQIVEAEGFHSKAVKDLYEAMGERRAALPGLIEGLHGQIQTRTAELGAAAATNAELNELKEQHSGLQKEQKELEKEYALVHKDHQKRLRALGLPNDLVTAPADAGEGSRWPSRRGSLRRSASEIKEAVETVGVKAVGLGFGLAGKVARGVKLQSLGEGLQIMDQEIRRYADDYGHGRSLEENRTSLAELKADIALLKNIHKEENPENKILQLSAEGLATLELFAATMGERGEATNGLFGSLTHRPHTARAAIRAGLAKAKNPAEVARMFSQKGSAIAQLGGAAGSQSPQLMSGLTKAVTAFTGKLPPGKWSAIQGAGAVVSTISNYRSTDLINWKNMIGKELREELAGGKIQKKHDKMALVATMPTSSGKMFAHGLESGAIANFVGLVGSISRRTGLGAADTETKKLLRQLGAAEDEVSDDEEDVEEAPAGTHTATS